MKRPGLLQRHGNMLLIALAAFSALAGLLLAGQVARDLRDLATAHSDNVIWSLAQTEVEFLDLQNALIRALADTDAPDALPDVRLEFDIFYGRVNILGEGQVYGELRSAAGFAAALAAVQDFLDQSVPLIDADDATLVAGLPGLGASLAEVKPLVRRLVTAGLAEYARLSDARSDENVRTLVYLAGAMLALVAALVLLAFFHNRVRRRATRRGKELTEAYARMNAVLSASIDGVVLTDAFGRVLDMNPAAEQMFGYSTAKAQGRLIGDLIVPDALRDQLEAGLRRLRKDGASLQPDGHRLRQTARNAEGTEFPVELVLRRTIRKGEPILMAFIRDISANVANERELTEARDRALAGEKAKADFLAVMSHEIRTPLNGILGNVALLRESDLTADQARCLRNMGISARILMEHVDSVLSLTRFATGLVDLNEEPVDVAPLLQDLVDGQESHALAQGNRLSWAWAGEPCDQIAADRAALQQILLNLVSNAIKFTRNGEVRIEVSASDREIAFRVIDTGTGIAAADLPHVFDDFRTTDASFGRMAGGAGLGLGIARRLAQAMGGTITVTSTEGQGSAFRVVLPIRCPRTSVAPQPDPAAATLTVLVVEDNEINLEVTRDMILQLGHRVEVARSGREGAQKAALKRFDLILMDIAMPELDGLAATQRIRTGDGASSDAPIVALTANILASDRKRFLEAGMQDVLTKPLQTATLRHLLSPDRLSPLVPEAAMQMPAPLRQRFERELSDLLDWLSGTVGDCQEIAARCHTMAGTAALFGEEELRARLLDLETAATSDAPAQRLQELVSALDLTRHTAVAVSRLDAAE